MTYRIAIQRLRGDPEPKYLHFSGQIYTTSDREEVFRIARDMTVSVSYTLPEAYFIYTPEEIT